MSGTKSGGAITVVTIKERYGENYYKKIGKLGGSTPKTKPAGFAANRERARIAGAKGGSVSRRTSAKKPVATVEQPDWKITIERTNPFSEAFKRLASPLRNLTKR